ncbi:MAG: hypothetical protein J0H43_00140, partial [Actinobacteria bacterium]|nr:hypothetical protein [Actinomycetota bacterium]
PTTSTIPVAGWIAEDERSIEALRTGQLTKKLVGGDLLTSARELIQTLTAWWPPVQAPQQAPWPGPAAVAPGTPGAPPMNVGGWAQ